MRIIPTKVMSGKSRDKTVEKPAYISVYLFFKRSARRARQFKSRNKRIFKLIFGLVISTLAHPKKWQRIANFISQMLITLALKALKKMDEVIKVNEHWAGKDFIFCYCSKRTFKVDKNASIFQSSRRRAWELICCIRHFFYTYGNHRFLACNLNWTRHVKETNASN